MNYIYLDGVQIVALPTTNIKLTNKISNNTANTWQQNRSELEKQEDTQQGKIAEEAIEKYIEEYKDFKYLSYDDIREDDYKKHAPFDGVLYCIKKTSSQIFKEGLSRIKEDVKNNEYGQISAETRNFLRENNIFTVEIKSTKINETKKDQAIKNEGFSRKLLIEAIRRDDFLIYPHFCRKSSSIFNFEQYLNYVYKQEFINEPDYDLRLNKLLKIEYENTSDIQIRVYLSYEEEKCYLMGYTLSKSIIQNKTIKKFRKKNKSEEAIYLSLPLAQGKSLNLLFSDQELWSYNIQINKLKDLSPNLNFDYISFNDNNKLVIIYKDNSNPTENNLKELKEISNISLFPFYKVEVKLDETMCKKFNIYPLNKIAKQKILNSLLNLTEEEYIDFIQNHNI